METDVITLTFICLMIVFVMLVKAPHKNTGFQDRYNDTVIEFRAGKLTEVQK